MGGMGVVYLGRAGEGTLVAVKTLHASDADSDNLRARFDREATALGMVQGPGIAALVAVSEDADETPWLAMEYVPGLDLATYLDRNGPVDALTGAALGLVLAGALTDIHTAGLLHRDLKPANVMLGPDGPKVVDFGLVAIGAAGGDLTVTGSRLGTPRFMAPEQITGRFPVTGTADAYALGGVLAYATSGRHPYTRPTADALVYAVASPDVRPDLTGVPEPLLRLVSGLLELRPQDRPDLADVRARLTEYLAAEGLSPAAARARLAERTHVRGTEIDDTVRPAARPATAASTPAAIRPATAGTGHAARTAARLRRAYARPGTS